MLEALSGFIIHLIQTTNYFGVFILMSLESALIPIPSEVTMSFAGFLANKGLLSLPLIIITGALGNLIGSYIAYALGYYLNENIIKSFIKKYGKFVLVTTEDFEKSVKWFNKYGNGITFFSRLLPAVRTFISLPAGLAKMNFFKFSMYTFLGSLIWSSVLAYFGYYLGSKWNTLDIYFRKFQMVIIVLMVVAVVYYINHKLKLIKFKKG